MSCSICGRGKCMYLECICCKVPSNFEGIKICPRCTGCNKEKYFSLHPSIEIRLFTKKGYKFDYEEIGDKERTFIQTNKQQKHVLITPREMKMICDDFMSDATTKIEIYKNGVFLVKIDHKGDVSKIIQDYIEFIPKREYHDFKKKTI